MDNTGSPHVLVHYKCCGLTYVIRNLRMANLLPCVRACDLWGPSAAACLDACGLRATSNCFGDIPGGGAGPEGLPVLFSIGLAIVLVPLSGLFAGLTLGLLSLDLVGLRVSPHIHFWKWLVWIYLDLSKK